MSSADAGTLGELAATQPGRRRARSRSSQATNQLLALGVKQQLQLQNLMAAQFREAALERARRAQAEEEGAGDDPPIPRGRQGLPRN